MPPLPSGAGIGLVHFASLDHVVEVRKGGDDAPGCARCSVLHLSRVFTAPSPVAAFAREATAWQPD